MTYFLQKNVKFLQKWEKLAADKKPFKPAKKSLDYYSIEKADMTHDEIKTLLAKKQKYLQELQAGSPYRKPMIESLKRIIFPEWYEKEE